MKKILLTMVVLLLASTIKAQQPTQVLWDYFEADKVTFGVTRFNVCIDNNNGQVGTCIDVAPNGGLILPDTTTGAVTYTTNLPSMMSNGNHSVAVMACAMANCSDPTVITFVLNNKPKSPVKVRVK